MRWQGFPFSAQDPLNENMIKRILQADPAVAARKEKEKAAGASTAK